MCDTETRAMPPTPPRKNGGDYKSFTNMKSCINLIEFIIHCVFTVSMVSSKRYTAKSPIWGANASIPWADHSPFLMNVKKLAQFLDFRILKKQIF